MVTQADDHVNIRLISQLIKGISRVLQKNILMILLLQHFFELSSPGVFSVIFILDLYDSESVMSSGSSI